MAVTNAVSSYGTTITYAGNAIAECNSIDGPEKSLNTIDASHLTSADHYKEFIGGFRDGGEVTLEGNFYPGDTLGQIALSTALDNATVGAFVITFPASTGTTWTFTALVTKFKTGAPLDDKLPFSVTLKISGKPTLGVTLSTGMSGWSGVEEAAAAALVEVPGFAIGVFTYSCVVDTTTTWVTMTPTAAAHTIVVTDDFDDSTQTIPSGNTTGQMDIGAADSVTLFTVNVKEAAKAAKNYYFYIVRP